ncbi:hypothetical protein WJX74_002251 [Apatococcus lobatus]|uniref:Mitochondrial assembly of ribosomal large subunit protein 1 n=1 Tax=Apatococcus lobatus TaxID=904363 RepID=A0AAW1QHS0_9CHLO
MLSRRLLRIVSATSRASGKEASGFSIAGTKAYGTRPTPELDDDGVQLTWPLPPEVLAQMDPTTRLTMLRAIQSSGDSANISVEASAHEPSIGDHERQQTGATASTSEAALSGHWTFPRANAEPVHHVRPRLPPFDDSADCSSQVAQMLVGAKLDDVQLMDVRQHCSFADFMVLATARSHRHVITAARAVAYQLSCHHEDGASPPRPTVHGAEGSEWILVDAGDVLAHVFLEGTREQYNLEELWRRHTTMGHRTTVGLQVPP